MTFDCGKETNTRGKPTDDCQNTPTSHLIRSQHPSALMTSALVYGLRVYVSFDIFTKVSFDIWRVFWHNRYTWAPWRHQHLVYGLRVYLSFIYLLDLFTKVSFDMWHVSLDIFGVPEHLDSTSAFWGMCIRCIWNIHTGLIWHMTHLFWHIRRTRAPSQHQRLLQWARCICNM